MPPIEAPTLSDGDVLVRPLADGDVDAIVRACRDREIPRWTRVPNPYTREDALRFLAVAATEAASGAGVALAIADAEDRLIGTIGLMEVDTAAGTAEIGYWLGREARGTGAATRAVRLVCDWAVRDLGLHTLEILAHPDNGPSVRVAERAGFVATGETRSLARMPAGRRDDYAVHVWPPPEGGRPA
jgi:RimJ/RimL family protein N-acetyltransferase